MGANHNDQNNIVSYQFELATCNLIAAPKRQNLYKARKQGQGAYPRKKARASSSFNRPEARARKR
ncbi:hypothetical protein D0C16_08805 [Cellvibrio sp. KY-GH-1]|nr:hypothetical protein D0C16_08805 [Cellvibrio sp. KY-GH-1]